MDEIAPLVLEALKTVYDPEIPVNIFEMGLIYDVLVDKDGRVGVRMTLTAPACPAAQSLPVEVRDKARGVAGVTERQGRDRVGSALDQGHDVRGSEIAAGALVGARSGRLGNRDTLAAKSFDLGAVSTKPDQAYPTDQTSLCVQRLCG